MGMVRESEDMQKEVNEIVRALENPPLLSAKINAMTDLSVCVRPLCYDVLLSGKKILSLNCPENAVVIYYAMLADLKGEIYHG